MGAKRNDEVPLDQGLTLVVLLRFHGIGADPKQISHRFGAARQARMVLNRTLVISLEESGWSNDFKAHSDKRPVSALLGVNGNFRLSERRFRRTCKLNPDDDPEVHPLKQGAADLIDLYEAFASSPDDETKRLVALAQHPSKHVGGQGAHGMMFSGPCSCCGARNYRLSAITCGMAINGYRD